MNREGRCKVAYSLTPQSDWQVAKIFYNFFKKSLTGFRACDRMIS
jgi:hypothetical protein